jgi:tetratricopeptide (TPR) repeat protein
VSDLPEGYKEVSEEDRARANDLFAHGQKTAATGNYEYAITVYMSGLGYDPDAIEAHSDLRDIALKRTVSGGKAMKMWDAMKIKRATSDDKQNMLNAEKLLAYEPGNTDHMLWLFQSAHRAGFYDTLLWIGPILQKANLDLGDKKQDFSKFIALRDVYRSIKQYRLASVACQYASNMRPDDMDLTTEVKNLAAMSTIEQAGYDKPGSFRSKVKDMNKQAGLLRQDRDVNDADSWNLMIADAEKEFNAEPNDGGKMMKLVDTLVKTEDSEHENRAVEILQEWFEKTKQFRYRQHIGVIHMKQMTRMDRSKRAALSAATDPEERRELTDDYIQFNKEKLEFELSEYELAANAYPTEMRLRFEIGVRLFHLGRFGDAIPILQQSRNDPKYKIDGGMLLGKAFLEAGFVDEADETLGALCKEYPVPGDTRSKELFYQRGRALEQRGLKDEAKNHYSKVAQWDFNYKDVQARLKKLRDDSKPKL